MLLCIFNALALVKLGRFDARGLVTDRDQKTPLLNPPKMTALEASTSQSKNPHINHNLGINSNTFIGPSFWYLKVPTQITIATESTIPSKSRRNTCPN